MKYLQLTLLSAFIMMLSCHRDDADVATKIIPIGENYLIFGHYYGECNGETCIETFKLTDNKLFEDIIDDPREESFEFIELENELFELVNDLMEYFPNELLNSSETSFGCPDCSDGGALIIKYSKNGIIRRWAIDQSQNDVPDYLHTFMDKVNEKIALLND